MPLLLGIPGFASAPALLIVGSSMMSGLRQIQWDDPAEAIASFLTLLVVPLSFSIAEGLAVGFISYPLLKFFQGKGHQISPVLWVLAAIFVGRYLLS